MPTTQPIAPLALAVLAACGCGESRRSAIGALRTTVDTIGDTVVVQTVGGSVWGETELRADVRIGAVEGADHEMFGAINGLAVGRDGAVYVYDAQVPALRRYAAGGRYLMTLGGRGRGPGEYANSDGGLAVLRDGRVVLRDPGNARLTVYGPDGLYLDSWPTRAGVFTYEPILPAADGGLYSPLVFPGQPVRLVYHDSDGMARDTVPVPRREIERPTVTARRERSSQTWPVPFTTSVLTVLHPEGFLSAITSEYVVELQRRDGSVMRFGRAGVEPVPVPREEREAERDRVTRAMRGLDPSWRWDGPSIPETKPIIHALYAGVDGRIWVLVHQPGLPVQPDAADTSESAATPRFREETVFEVFEPDGRYLGRVRAPPEFSRWPAPVFQGETVWATSRDELGVQYVVRYRIAGRD